MSGNGNQSTQSEHKKSEHVTSARASKCVDLFPGTLADASCSDFLRKTIMQFFRRDFLFFLLGVLSLGLFGWMVRRRVKKPVESTNDTLPGVSLAAAQDFELPEQLAASLGDAQNSEHRLDDLVFRVDRKRKVVCAYHAAAIPRDAEAGELVWESQGEDQWIVPGAAFPMDISPTGELWVANVGRRRLEQLDPKTGRFIASWEPKQAFGGCCNPVRFAALSGGRFVTMEKGVRRACIYLPTGELESVVTDTLSDSESNYYLLRDEETIHLYDTGIRKHWKVR